ncbi:MAG: alanine--glyoxylate aminotransferase family protein [Bacteroidetes bacterium]|nr:alanine--glyoxylate aminotransferase family protein [Bacteroidota bacterium]
MKPMYFTPGPSQLYHSYQTHLQAALDQNLGSINHRSSKFREIYKYTDTQLRQLLNIPSSHSIFFASSATEIWERILLNVVEQKSFHFINGAFSKRFYNFSSQLQKNPSCTVVADGLGFDIATIDIPSDVELICTTQNETATGVYFPSEDLGLLKNRYPNQLLCCDLVSIAPYSEIDYNAVDLSFFSVQKAFGMPPGLGVLIANKTCIEKSNFLKAKGLNIGAHNTFEAFQSNYMRFETPSTPNVIAIYILGKIAADFNSIGIHHIRKEMQVKAANLYAFANTSDYFKPFVTETKHQSETVIVLKSKVNVAEVISYVKQYGYIIGSGYGIHAENQLRIANFPATTKLDMDHLINVLSNFKPS